MLAGLKLILESYIVCGQCLYIADLKKCFGLFLRVCLKCLSFFNEICLYFQCRLYFLNLYLNSKLVYTVCRGTVCLRNNRQKCFLHLLNTMLHFVVHLDHKTFYGFTLIGEYKLKNIQHIYVYIKMCVCFVCLFVS